MGYKAIIIFGKVHLILCPSLNFFVLIQKSYKKNQGYNA
jgi:hypothetical protein